MAKSVGNYMKRAVARKLPEAKKVALYDLIREQLHKMAKAGEWMGDPNDHPIQAMTRLAYHPDTNQSLRYLSLKTLLEYVAVPKSVELRVESGADARDTNVTVVVQSWAKQPAAEIEAPAIDVSPPTRIA